MRLNIYLIALSLLAATASVVSAQVEKDARTLVDQALDIIAKDPTNGQLEAERLVRQGLVSLKQSAKPERYAEACVTFGLLLIGSQRPADVILLQLEEALRVYGEAMPPIEDGRLALVLEAKAQTHATAGDTELALSLAKKAAAIRKRLIEELQSKDDAGSSEPPLRIGGGVSIPSIVAKVEPTYSESARLVRKQGAARFSVVIDTDGRVRTITLVSSLGFGLDEAGYQAVSTWRFRPAMKDGNPVPVVANIEVNFRLL